MRDQLRDARLVEKVGGQFKLSTLIQKRMVALMRGATPLVEGSTDDLMDVALREIQEGKIFLDKEGTAQAK